MTPLTEEQTKFVLKAFGQYLDVWERELDGRLPTSVDAAHSALLPWLLAGYEPLPVPPPKLYSRPCHSLDAFPGNAKVRVDKPWKHELENSHRGADTVVGQDPYFKDLGKDRYEYVQNGHVYVVTEEDGHYFVSREVDRGPEYGQVNGHVGCPCWASGAYYWVEGCTAHPRESVT